ncbi:MAG: 3-deoxy-D-manno-octulosonate 8-phosphate phosphatase [Marinilabiliales bacterium]|nr:MAG: 3-deoxy-D-manno-octulosonate 8-phosphate phosphatase [Marinilabiliales bacterium]
MNEEIKNIVQKIKAFAFDVDGVFSGHILMDCNGNQLHPLNMKDGYAMQLLNKLNLPVAIITGGNSEMVKKRFLRLGVPEQNIYMRSFDKQIPFDEFIKRYNLQKDEVAFMGDDMPDYKVMQHCGLPVCPADASEDILKLSKYVTKRSAGYGCVRELVEMVLKEQGKWWTEKTFTW